MAFPQTAQTICPRRKTAGRVAPSLATVMFEPKLDGFPEFGRNDRWRHAIRKPDLFGLRAVSVLAVAVPTLTP